MIDKHIPFELHVTLSDIKTTQINFFTELCNKLEGKPLLIELAQGQFCKQPMFNAIVHHHDVSFAINNAKKYAIQLAENGFEVNRLKIEIPAYCSEQFDDEQNLQNVDYFEWHGKIDFTRKNILLDICAAHKAHLSKNSLKNNNSQRFITLREFAGKHIFENRVTTLIASLQKNGFEVHKQQAEYCIYDTNIILDKDWLPQ